MQMQNAIGLALILVFLAGLIWGAYLDHSYIRYQIKKKTHIPKFLGDLGVVINPESQNKADKQ